MDMADASGLLREKETNNFVACNISFLDEEKILQQIILIIDKEKQKSYSTSRNKILISLNDKNSCGLDDEN